MRRKADGHSFLTMCKSPEIPELGTLNLQKITVFVETGSSQPATVVKCGDVAHWAEAGQLLVKLYSY